MGRYRMRDVLFNAVLPERTAEAHRTILTRCSPADDPAQPAVHRYGGGAGQVMDHDWGRHASAATDERPSDRDRARLPIFA